MKKYSGILLPVSSLPSEYGIGTFGKAAFKFIDFLKKSGQSYWQILPLGTTGYGNSPYQSFSAFAGNPYFIDLEILVEEGLLELSEIEKIDFDSNPQFVDYGKIYAERMNVLRKAALRGLAQDNLAYREFVERNKTWLEDYALFMVLKQENEQKSWSDWANQDIRNHEEIAIAEAKEQYQAEMQIHFYIQFLFEKQWEDVRAYAKKNQIQIVGDIPLYLSFDSADVWTNPHLFQLDEHRVPTEVAGVPPDYFTADGQLWSNPLYDWDLMEKNQFAWWISRIQYCTKIYDALRIDHFRGIESYWAVPYGETTACHGRWRKGPGMKLINALKNHFPDFSFIAEDLGYQTMEVKQLLADSGFPGMNVIQLDFDSRDDVSELPENYKENSVCYLGTHDNAPINLWKKQAKPEDVLKAKKYFELSDDEPFHLQMLSAGLATKSRLFVAQMQDVLGLAENTRMNTPGTMEHNWEWRVLSEQLNDEIASLLYELTANSNRLPE